MQEFAMFRRLRASCDCSCIFLQKIMMMIVTPEAAADDEMNLDNIIINTVIIQSNNIN